MCGITGLIDKNNSGPADRELAVKLMTETLVHRGPDESAYLNVSGCSLGMRRLSILDLNRDLYPFTNPSASHYLIFNGEIYNYPELRKELESSGYIFKSGCDGEAVLHGYDKWGTDVFSHLRGMFAIAIWDVPKKALILARDRFGIKPLYYVNQADYFAFASEAKALYTLRESIGLHLQIDDELLASLLGFMFLPETVKTLVSPIKKLAPGSLLVINASGVSEKKYWTLETKPEYASLNFEDAVDLIDKKLTESISMHMLADVPLGVMLSGGVDSALLAAIMAKKLGITTNTYTAKFEHKYNESNLAAETARLLGTHHLELSIDVADLNTNIDSYIGVYDDLSTFDGGMLTTSLLCRQIAPKSAKVLLLGEGADEVFGGYSWFGLAKAPFSYMPGLMRDAFYYYAISRNLTYKFLDYAGYWRSKSFHRNSTFNDIASRELLIQLPNHLLMKVDKGTMAQSIEARVPYLDHELVELAYSLPSNYKLGGTFVNLQKSNEKRILRAVAERYLPSSIAYRKKRGFMLPMKDVLQSNTSSVRDRVLATNAVGLRVLPKDFLNSLFQESSFDLINTQKEYFKWRLFILEAWATHYKLA